MNEATEKVVHRMKYGGFPSAGRSLGRWIALGRTPPSHAILVPIPIHWRRRWRRGFNPTQALAEGLSATWGLEVRPGLLRRVKHQASLTSSSRAKRQQELIQTFQAPLSREKGEERSVVLIDDVLTTGATFRACRAELESRGHAVIGGVWLAMA